MYTFGQVLAQSGKLIDISIPNKSVVRVVGAPTEEIYFLEQIATIMPIKNGNIYYDGINIHMAQKSYRKKIAVYASPFEMLDPNLTIENNLKFISTIYNVPSLWKYPIKFFQLDDAVLDKYPAELSDVEIFCINVSPLFWFQGNIWIMPIIFDISTKFDSLKQLVSAKVNDGNGTLFYSSRTPFGFNGEIEIKI